MLGTQLATFCLSQFTPLVATRGKHPVVQANPRRVAKVTKLIEREIGSLMQTDSLLMDITKPKSTAGDVKGTLCSCTGVHVTSDLQVVKVYVSVYSDDDAAKEHTVKRLTGVSGCATIRNALNGGHHL